MKGLPDAELSRPYLQQEVISKPINFMRSSEMEEKYQLFKRKVKDLKQEEKKKEEELNLFQKKDKVAERYSSKTSFEKNL